MAGSISEVESKLALLKIAPSTFTPTSKSFPEILPREIRQQIFRYVLSPTGSVKLFVKGSSQQMPSRYLIFSSERWDETISLALFRTCRTIYQDCKDLFWTYNSVYIDDHPFYPTLFAEPLQRMELDRVLAYQIRNIEINLDVFHRGPYTTRSPAKLEVSLNCFETWASAGNLNTITIHLVQGTMRSVKHQYLSHITRHRSTGDAITQKVYKNHLAILREFTAPGKPLALLKRTTQINTYSPYASFYNDKKGLPQCDFDNDPDDVLLEFNHAWGGDLFINGILTYRDGGCVRKAFCKPQGSEVWFYALDLMIWRTAKLHENEIRDGLSLRSKRSKRAIEFGYLVNRVVDLRRFRERVMEVWKENEMDPTLGMCQLDDGSLGLWSV